MAYSVTVEGLHPCILAKFTLKPVRARRDDAEQASVPQAVLDAFQHETGWELPDEPIPDFESSLILRFGERDFLDQKKMMEWLENDATATPEHRMLHLLPEEVQQTIKDNRMNVCFFRPSMRQNIPRRKTVVLELRDILHPVLRSRGYYDLWSRPNDPPRCLAMAGQREDGYPEWICYMELPGWKTFKKENGGVKKEEVRGTLLAIPYELIERVLSEKCYWLCRVYPDLLEIHPPQERRDRRRQQHAEETADAPESQEFEEAEIIAIE